MRINIEMTSVAKYQGDDGNWDDEKIITKIYTCYGSCNKSGSY